MQGATDKQKKIVQDAASSHLHIASCYEDSEEDSNSEMTKYRLITTTRSSDESLEAEEQDKGLVCQSFCLGSAIGFLLQSMSFATWYTIFNVWGQNTTFSGTLSLVSYWMILTVCRQVDVVVYICFWLVVYSTRTISRDICTFYCAKSWTRMPIHRLVPIRFGRESIFWFGVNTGALSVSTIIVHLCMGVSNCFMAVSYVVDCALFWLVLKCFECEQKTREEKLAEQEKVEEKDDYKFSFPVAW
jgi:hypothetical protein